MRDDSVSFPKAQTLTVGGPLFPGSSVRGDVRDRQGLDQWVDASISNIELLNAVHDSNLTNPESPQRRLTDIYSLTSSTGSSPPQGRKIDRTEALRKKKFTRSLPGL